MNELMNKKIQDMIFEVRGKLVILDRDIAKICGVETKRINEAISRNYIKFSDSIAWRLSDKDVNFLVADCDQKIEKRGSKYNNPRVFTLEGIEVLSTILKSKISYELLEKIRMAFNETNNSNYTLITAKNPESIENLIYEIRGKYVILDSDLARLYRCENGTKSINLAVNRNKERFPNDFVFRLTLEEINMIRSRFQIETLNKGVFKRGGNIKYLPYAFTEQGVAMLSSVLKTHVAATVSVNIMRAFVHMKKYISNNLIEQKYVNELVFKDNKRIDLLEDALSKLCEKREIVNEIFFKGQIYDAYSTIIDIMKHAKNELIVIDAYADKMVLDMVKELNCHVKLIVKPNKRLKELDVQKYCSQYNNLEVLFSDIFHDRYFIIDDNKIYHSGTSVNNAESKVFSIDLINDEIVKKALIEKIKEL